MQMNRYLTVSYLQTKFKIEYITCDKGRYDLFVFKATIYVKILNRIMLGIKMYVK